MLKNPHKILVYLNLLVIVVLYGDLLTSSFSIPEELDEIYASKEKYERTSTGQNRYEIHNYLQCKSGNIYKIGIIPEIEIETGKEIEINETKFLNKVKSFEFKEDGILKKINLSFLLDPYVLVFLILTFVFTMVHFYNKHALIEYGLSVFSLLTYSITFVYLYYL